MFYVTDYHLLMPVLAVNQNEQEIALICQNTGQQFTVSSDTINNGLFDSKEDATSWMVRQPF